VGTDLVGDCDAAGVPFQVGKVFAGEHHTGRIEGFGGRTGAQQVDAIQAGLGIDLVVFAGYCALRR
jgi:hypothetical protein